METDVACQLFKDAPQTKVKYSSYVGDDDSTTLSELVKQQPPYELQKFSDIIYIKRSLGTKLYNVSQRMKFPNCSVLSQKVINYLQKCFLHCINQNKDNPVQLSKEVKTIIPHAFGAHSDCNPTWCRFLQDPIGYTHHKLPYGKDLQLAPCLNSQGNKKKTKQDKHKAKPEFKIKRRKLFQDKCSKQTKKESKDNAPYESNIGLNLEHSKPSQGKENEHLTILKDVDLAKATITTFPVFSIFNKASWQSWDKVHWFALLKTFMYIKDLGPN
ncbi:Hypothetical predicted protein, partial [Paramuricea clavata]